MTAACSVVGVSSRDDNEPDRADFLNAACAVIDRWAQSNPGNVRLRLADTDDLSALHSLNSDAIMGLGEDGLFMPMPKSFLSEMIRNGIILLIERGGEPLGYSVAVPAGRDHPPFIPGPDSGRTGLLFGTALDQAMRGQGWHLRLIRMRKRIFSEAGFVSAQSTASPFNSASLANLMNSGFHVSGLKNLLDGHPRFLLECELAFESGQRSEPTGRQRHVLLPKAGNLSDHQTLLADGLVATGIRKGQNCTLIYSRRPEPHSGEPNP